MTKYFKIDKNKMDKPLISKTAAALKAGKLVIFPTETVYGIAADPLNENAVRKLFKAKKRPADRPLQLLISGRKQVKYAASKIPKRARDLMKKFWPGPLTIVLRKNKKIPDIVTAGLNTVGLRIPDHPVAIALIEAFGRPIAASSANVSGKRPPKTAKEAMRYLKNGIEIALDSGKVQLGKASKVLDATSKKIKVIRK